MTDSKGKPQTRSIECKHCGARGMEQLIKTNVPGTIPVWFWLCPNCDKKGR